ncbi:hypothetical protein ACS0TY_009839 [Phlomoides rotata]
MALRLLIPVVLAAALLLRIASADNDFSWISTNKSAACGGSITECMGYDGEFKIDNWRILATTDYISYGALEANSVLCSWRGASYYNCQPDLSSDEASPRSVVSGHDGDGAYARWPRDVRQICGGGCTDFTMAEPGGRLSPSRRHPLPPRLVRIAATQPTPPPPFQPKLVGSFTFF